MILITFGFFNLRLVARKWPWIVGYDSTRNINLNASFKVYFSLEIFILIIMKSMDNPCSDCVKSLCPENKDEPSANILETDLILFCKS